MATAFEGESRAWMALGADFEEDLFLHERIVARPRHERRNGRHTVHMVVDDRKVCRGAANDARHVVLRRSGLREAPHMRVEESRDPFPSTLDERQTGTEHTPHWLDVVLAESAVETQPSRRQQHQALNIEFTTFHLVEPSDVDGRVATERVTCDEDRLVTSTERGQRLQGGPTDGGGLDTVVVLVLGHHSGTAIAWETETDDARMVLEQRDHVLEVLVRARRAVKKDDRGFARAAGLRRLEVNVFDIVLVTDSDSLGSGRTGRGGRPDVAKPRLSGPLAD